MRALGLWEIQRDTDEQEEPEFVILSRVLKVRRYEYRIFLDYD